MTLKILLAPVLLVLGLEVLRRQYPGSRWLRIAVAVGDVLILLYAVALIGFETGRGNWTALLAIPAGLLVVLIPYINDLRWAYAAWQINNRKGDGKTAGFHRKDV